MAVTILGDWGNTRLRLWQLDDGAVRDRREGPGIGALLETPEDTLSAIIAPWQEKTRAQRITLCGMAGARGALHEVAYLDCPADLAGWRSSAASAVFQSIPLRIAAGVACRDTAGVPDVMRGEETQLFGALTLEPGLREGCHRLILPGTHSKWVWLEDGRISGFRTFLTGELFGLLQGSSLLSAAGNSTGKDESQGFTDGIHRARGDSGILGHLFEARATQLRDGRSPRWARGFLSGLIIGSEVAEMLRSDVISGTLTIIGDPQLAARYEAALGGYGAEARLIDGDGCVLAGLRVLDADD